jgi:hypothetical protein
VSQLWDLDGDGAFDDGAGAVAAHVYPGAGAFGVRLLVTDSDRAEVLAERVVEIRPRPTAFLSPFPVVRLAGSQTATGAWIRRLTVQVPPGSRVEVRCRGRGCKRRRQTRLAPAGPAARLRVLRFRRFERRLGARAVLEIFVTKPGTVGKYTRYLIRKGAPPRRTDRCLPPGAKRPSRCPAG